MHEWLDQFSVTQVDAEVSTLAVRLVVAWLCGWVVARIARLNQPPGTTDTLTLTLILMSILIAMATQIIGDNIARAFSLVGALSIVRFRTAVSATRDIAFVLAAVVVGMAVGAGQYWVSGLGLVVIAVATLLNRHGVTAAETDAGEDGEASDEATKRWRITLQVGLSSTDGWEPELTRLTERFELLSAATTRRGAAMEMVYRVLPKEDCSAVQIVAALNAVPSVESVTAKAN